MGLRKAVARSTLADANEFRDWRIWADLAAVLIKRARKLYLKDDFGLDLANTVYALDSTTIDLCLSLFPWADFRSTKAAVKMHTLLDLRGPIPSFIHISDGKMGDAAALDLIVPEAGAIYVMDRGYVDFRRLYALHRVGAFFVTRTKINMNYHRVYSRAVDKRTGSRFDQSIALDGFYTRQEYASAPRRFRRSGNRQTTYLSDQPFCVARPDNRGALQAALASRTVFQVDQTEPTHPPFLWNIRKRGEDANLDGSMRLRARGHRQKGTGAGCCALHFSTDFVRPFLRKNPHFAGVFSRRSQPCPHDIG